MDNGAPILQNSNDLQAADPRDEMSEPTVPPPDLAQQGRADQRLPLDAIFATGKCRHRGHRKGWQRGTGHPVEIDPESVWRNGLPG